jgi:hypothetical protein
MNSCDEHLRVTIRRGLFGSGVCTEEAFETVNPLLIEFLDGLQPWS